MSDLHPQGDSKLSVVALSAIVFPRKALHEYVVGEEVTAPFQEYAATIYQIGDDRKSLNKTLDSGFKVDFSRMPNHPAAECSMNEKERHKSAEVVPETTMTNRAPLEQIKQPQMSREFLLAAAEQPKKRRTKSGRKPLDGQKKPDHPEWLDEQARQIIERRKSAWSVATQLTQTLVPLPPAQTQVQLPSDQTHVQVPSDQTQVHLPPAQIQVQLPPAQTIIQLPAAQNQVQLPPAQTQVQLPPAQTQVHLPPAQTQVLLPSAQTQVQLPPAQTQVQLPPAQTQVQLPPAQTQVKLPAVQTQVQLPAALTQFLLPQTKIQPVHSSTPIKTGFTGMPQHVGYLEMLSIMEEDNFQVENLEKRTGNRESTTRVNLSTIDAIKASIHYENREAKALMRAMNAIFTRTQLVECSMRGAATSRHGTPRPGLPKAECQAIIEIVAKKFDRPVADVERKMRAALRRLKEILTGLD
ncbi:hypothetical protein DPMN_077712 [Dreissena polymorpha]|uniref:BEN domain-containing protein n=1 Tax=Dreissena polymorpha TaxID=45954 RepID=A0A9D3YQI2_DREPO|nr:hypothetical protein DPMN_077712 [Dreissena polymorpha]